MKFWRNIRVLKWVLVVTLTITVVAWSLVISVPVKKTQIYGVTFAPFVAESFGLDPKEVYRAIFEDLGAEHVRLGAYWDRIERERGIFRFEELDWQIEEAEKHQVEIILAMGKKVPRWPECHIPSWALSLEEKEQEEALLKYIKVVVTRYRNSKAIKIWQVENEPFLPFGECPDNVSMSLDREIALARSLDSRPIMVTDSGELSIWIRAAKRSDIFGTTMYRRVYNPYFGEFTYPLPAWFFRFKRAVTEAIVGERPMIVVELQAEPWIKKPIYAATVEEQYASMNPEYLKDSLEYASRSGFDTFYLWGVEWWYYLKQQGKGEIWDIVKDKVAGTS